MASYPIIANCNFERGSEIDSARRAVEAGLTADEALVAALDGLEETLYEYADSYLAHHAVSACRSAERAVLRAWTSAIEAEVEEARERRYGS